MIHVWSLHLLVIVLLTQRRELALFEWQCAAGCALPVLIALMLIYSAGFVWLRFKQFPYTGGDGFVVAIRR